MYEEIAIEVGKSMALALRAMEKAGTHLALRSGMRDFAKGGVLKDVKGGVLKGYAQDHERYCARTHPIRHSAVNVFVSAARGRHMHFPAPLVAMSMQVWPLPGENFAQAQRRFKGEPWTGYEPHA